MAEHNDKDDPQGKDLSTNNAKHLTPREIKDYLDNYIVGQEEAKKLLAGIGFMHYVRSVYSLSTREVIKHTNALLVGPTGSGKTYMVRRLAEVLQFPLLTMSALDLVKEGYSGESLNKRLEIFCKENSYHPDISHTIVFIDEIDKLGRVAPTTDSSNHNQEIQSALLTLIEGESTGMSYESVSTRHMLFIFAGAFTDIHEGRKPLKTIGYHGLEAIKESITVHEEVRKAGIIPELLGRIGHIVELKELTKDQLRKVILEVNDGPLQAANTLFEFLEQDFFLTEEEVDLLVEEAVTHKTGARAINALLEAKVLQKINSISYQGEVPING